VIGVIPATIAKAEVCDRLTVRALAAIALVAIGVVLTACGGDGDSKPSGSDTRTIPGVSVSGPTAGKRAPVPADKARYLAKGNRICRHLRKKLDPLASRYFALASELSAAEVGTFAKKAAALVRTDLARLQALTPPKRDERVVRMILVAAARGVKGLERAERSTAQANRILRGEDPLARAESLAGRYGLVGCSLL
jgi:hypothetical protein